MKYESTILKRLIDTYGVVGNPRYISEIIKEFIVRGKERFPELFTYQSDWLAHIDEFGLNPTYTVSYTGQSIYAPNTLERPVKSAILKGSTKYRDIETGEILESFEEGRNLELVSVRMPVLMTSNSSLFTNFDVNYTDNGKDILSDFIDVSHIDKNTKLYPTFDKKVSKTSFQIKIVEYNKDKKVIKSQAPWVNNTLNSGYYLNSNTYYIQLGTFGSMYGEFNKIGFSTVNDMVYISCKLNILSCNEEIILRSNGNVYDELDLMTKKLTQRIDENNEVLSQEVVKTVDLTIKDQNDLEVSQLSSFNGGTHFSTSSQEGSLLPSISVDVVTDLVETLNICSMDGNTL